jgi:hemerythrin-like domain-containing protein
MQARAPLMIEHRLIERMIAVIDRAIPAIRTENRVEPEFIDTVVDFFFTYIDRTHHGKEEEIYFKTLDGKPMSESDRALMRELIEEHARGRKIVGEVADANSQYRAGLSGAIPDLADGLGALTGFYPKHIEKEDKVFFPAARAYLSDQDEQAILEAFREFDRKVIHEAYREKIEHLERHPKLSGQMV